MPLAFAACPDLLRSGSEAVPCTRPVAACTTIAGRPVRVGLGAIRGAQLGGVRPPPHLRPVAASWHPGGRRSAPLRPATPRRLRLSCQIGDELVPGREEFLLVDDVVAVEDGAALVPGQEHGDALGDARADQVAGGRTPAIVEEAGRHPGGLAGGAPRRAPAADGNAVAVEDQRAVGVAARPPSRQGLGNGRRDGEDAPDQRLRAGRREPDDAAGPFDFLPGEAEDFVFAPAGVVGEIEDILPRGGQLGADGTVFGVLEEALAGGIFPEPVGEAGHGVESAPVDGEREYAVEGRGFPINGAGGRAGGVSCELILANLVCGQRGGPHLAAEERSEMSHPSPRGANGPELAHRVVFEIGVEEVPERRPVRRELPRRRLRRPRARSDRSWGPACGVVS